VNALKLYYLATYLGLGAVLPLFALAMEARGFRADQYRWLLVLLPLSRLIASPVWGGVADKWLGTARLLRINTLVATLAMTLLALSSSTLAVVITFALWAFFSSSLVPLAEAGTYRMLAGRAKSFGYVRAFGSMGFAVSAACVAAIGVDANFRLPFVLSAASYGVAAAVAFALADAKGESGARTRLFEAVPLLAKKPEMLLLWVGSTLYYVAHGAFDIYFGPHVKQLPGVDPKAAASAVSSAWAIGVVAEVLILFIVPRLLGRYSASMLLVVSAVVAASRWLWLAHVTTTFEVLAMAPLHGMTFGLWYLAFVHENQDAAPPELRATVQGLAAACLGLGSITATMCGSILLERLGGRALFEVACLFALASLLAYGVRMWLSARSGRQLATSLPSP
jgi:PPP family 3-phenylpropionic acid transporter